MKYTTEITIARPINTVIELFDNPDNLAKWMEGLQRFEHLSGTPGQPGAKSRLTFKMGKREMAMTETVLVRNLPDEFSGSYEAEGVYNHVANHFKAIDANTTLYVAKHEFQFKGIMRVIGFLFPGAFKKQSMKYLVAFKQFVESQ